MGLAAIVLAISGVVSTAFSLAVTHAVTTTPGTITSGQVGHDLATIAPLFGLTLVLSLLADIILTGLLTVVIGRGVLGQQLTMGQAWSLARPRLAARARRHGPDLADIRGAVDSRTWWSWCC